MIITVLWKLRKQEIVCLHSEVTASNSHVVPAMQQSELENENRTDQNCLMLLVKKCKNILTIVKSAMPLCLNSLCKSVHLIVKTITKLIVYGHLWNYFNSRTSHWNFKRILCNIKTNISGLDKMQLFFFIVCIILS